MQGEWIREPKGEASVIFVHGILSSGKTCWTHEESGAYWPELLKEDEQVPDVLGIYVYTYQTNLFSGNYSLSDVVDDLKERMRAVNLFDSKRIIFVCHSQGGIIVRKLIVERQTDFINQQIKIGLFLLGSPSLGSPYANWAYRFLRFGKLLDNAQLRALRSKHNNDWLNSLDKEFQNLKGAGKLQIEGKELIEDKFVRLRKLVRKPVVERVSAARYFSESLTVSLSEGAALLRRRPRVI